MKLLSYGLDHRMEPRLALSLKGYTIDVMRASLWMKENRNAQDYLNLASSMRLALLDWKRSLSLLKNLEEALQGIDDLSGLIVYDRPVALAESDIVFFAPVPDPPSLRYFHAFDNENHSGFSFGNTQTLLGNHQELTHPELTAQAEIAAIIARDKDGSNLQIAGYCIANNWLDLSVSSKSDGSFMGIATSLGPYLVTADELASHQFGAGFNLDMQIRVNGAAVAEDSFKEMRTSFADMTRQSEKTRVQAGDILCSGSPVKSGLSPVLQKNDQLDIEIQALGVLSGSVIETESDNGFAYNE